MNRLSPTEQRIVEATINETPAVDLLSTETSMATSESKFTRASLLQRGELEKKQTVASS